MDATMRKNTIIVMKIGGFGNFLINRYVFVWTIKMRKMESTHILLSNVNTSLFTVKVSSIVHPNRFLWDSMIWLEAFGISGIRSNWKTWTALSCAVQLFMYRLVCWGFTAEICWCYCARTASRPITMSPSIKQNTGGRFAGTSKHQKCLCNLRTWP